MSDHDAAGAPFRGLQIAFGSGLAGTVALVMITGLMVGLVSFVWPKSYRAAAVILPNEPTSTGSSLLQLAAGSGLGDLIPASIGGGENLILTYPEILRSQTVLERTLETPYPPGPAGGGHTVLDAIHVSGGTPRQRLDNGVLALRGMTAVQGNPRSGLITVSAVTGDSLLSAYVVQRMLDELNRFNVESRASQGQATREFVQKRLSEATQELTGAEQALAGFRAANLRIGNSPQLLLEQARLEREVETRSDVYRLLARQFELARIEEKRDTPTFSLVEPARPPVRKYRPRILFNVMLAIAIAVGLRVMITGIQTRASGWWRAR